MSSLHVKLAHLNQDYIRYMINNDFLSTNISTKFDLSGTIDCASCRFYKSQAQATPRQSSLRKSTTDTPLSEIPIDLLSATDLNSRTTEPLFRVHIDGFEFYFGNSSKCFYIFTDEGTDFKMVYFVKDKSAESFLTTVQTFHALAYYHHKTNIKTIRMDNGAEMSSEIFYEYARFNNIHLQRCTPYHHHQNGVAERSVRTCEETALTLLHHAHLSVPLFIVYAVSNAIQTRNKCVTKRTKARKCSPYELFTGAKPKLEDIHTIGETCYSYIQKDQRRFKYHPKARQCIFLCEDYERKAVLLMDVQSRSIISSRDVRFPRLGAVAVTPASFSPLSAEGQMSNSGQSGTTDDGHTVEEPRFISRELLNTTEDTAQSYESVTDDARPQTPQLTITEESWDQLYKNSERSSFSGSSIPSFCSSSDSEDEDDATLSENSENVVENEGERDVVQDINEPVAVDLNVVENDVVTSRGRRLVSNSRYFNSEYVNQVSMPETPKTYRQAMKSSQNEQWQEAMTKELESLKKNSTWDLVPRQTSMFVVKSKWVFKIKTDERGDIERFKARVVAMGFTQTFGVDYDETFSPVLNSVTRRILLSLAAQPKVISVQADVETAFLQSFLDHKIYLEPPPGMVVPDGYVLDLHRAIYGLKQSPLLWFNTLSTFLRSIGFTQCISDVCLFILGDGGYTVLLSVYVDDLIVSSESQKHLDMVLNLLKGRFPIRDVKKLSWTVGLHISGSNATGNLYVSQQAYIQSLVEKYLQEDKRQKSFTPMQSDSNALFNSVSDLLSNSNRVKLYQEIVGALNYLAHASRPDIMFAVNMLSRFLQVPREVHLESALRVIKYLNEVPNFSIMFATWEDNSIHLCAFCDASFAATPYVDGRSTTGILIYLNGSLILWKSSRQSIVSLSAMEAELQAISQTVVELQWIRSVLSELQYTVPQVMIFTDSEPAIKYLYRQSDVLKPRTRHLALRYHFIRKEIEDNLLELHYLPSRRQRADLLTKPLPRAQFGCLRELLSQSC